MLSNKLLELAKAGNYDEFESTCLEAVNAGDAKLAELIPAFEQLQRDHVGDKLGDLALTVLDAIEAGTDQKSALAVARAALFAAPKNEDLRTLTVTLYEQVYGDQPHFQATLEASGMKSGRPARMALKLLDLCLTLEPGQTLISRMDDRVAEITEIDRDNALFTLRQRGRVVTRPAAEVVREYDRVAQDDFRVLRQLRPDQLVDLIHNDPVAVVIGLIHAHGEMIDADQLKFELVPRYIDDGDWSKWWTKARNALKRSPHVIIEGRSPMILSFSAAGQSLEEEAWEAFGREKHPPGWLSVAEGYLREKASRKEELDQTLLQKMHDELVTEAQTELELHPGAALSCGLVLQRLAERGLTLSEEAAALPKKVLETATEPVQLLQAVQPEALRERGLDALQKARPDDWAEIAVRWLPHAHAALADKIATALVEAEQPQPVQAFIDQVLSDPAVNPEGIYWLWKGPKKKKALQLPADEELFKLIVDTLSALGRTVSAEAAIVREFRQRAKAALSLRSFARAKKCLAGCSAAAAVAYRRHLERLEGVGYTTQRALIEMLRDAHPQLWVVKRKRLETWEDLDTLWCTSEGLNKRTGERDDLVNVQMRENAKRIGEAASHGDLSENSEYKFALEERDLLRARLATINDELSIARTLDPEDVEEGRISIGARVRLRHVASGEEREMTFLGPFEANADRGIYSYKAPLAQTLMGRGVGDTVRLTLDGDDTEFEITAIENGMASKAPAPQQQES
jgi:transcription elongation GreA/GreB family factor